MIKVEMFAQKVKVNRFNLEKELTGLYKAHSLSSVCHQWSIVTLIMGYCNDPDEMTRRRG